GAELSSWASPANASLASSTGSTAVVERSIGYVAYWDQSRAVQSIGGAGAAVTEVSPSWYAPAADGSIVVQQAGAVDDSAAAVAQLRTNNALILPALANYRDKIWDSTVIGAILADPAKRAAHVEHIRALVRERGFDGIDIDYEQLTAADRDPFTAFVTALASGLHADGKLLAVTLHPKSSEPGPQLKNQAQNYAAIGRVADEVRIMLYDYQWDTSAPGSLAPINWVRSVMTWAATQVPVTKLVLGAATYGYDWVGKRGTSLMWAEIMRRARNNAATVQYSQTMDAPWFEYVDSRGRQHTVWFERAQHRRKEGHHARYRSDRHALLAAGRRRSRHLDGSLKAVGRCCRVHAHASASRSSRYHPLPQHDSPKRVESRGRPLGPDRPASLGEGLDFGSSTLPGTSKAMRLTTVR
ncbi:MAG: glycosyl hydrolase family 18 protein, partial [Geodermatophilaceae bacterium]